ncbi:AraC family transcriptional regulator [Cryptosporangium arvum]|uniref:AraC family transcriptional regulator n=1 Tax=Cryptosporangium arvum TaxID=80871 RepID=UPI0004B60903|nr:AraC family transcriptional regulator [Cryptosporangium arvum]
MSERSDDVRDRSADVLPDALATLGARPARLSTFAGGGDWALRFGRSAQVKVVAVEEGTCWVRAGAAEPVRLGAGEAYLLSGADYVTASDPAVRPRDGAAAARGDARYEAGTGPVTVRMVGTALRFADADGARLLLDGLPPARTLRGGVAATLSLLAAEATAGGRAGEALRRHLSQALYLQVFRSSALAGALSEPGIGAALLALHERPAEPWTVARLAAVARLSRTVFATRFAALVGVPPMDYLRRRRIAGADAELAAGRTVASVAGRWGYASESAFSAAYKRVTGHPPGARMLHPFRYD